MKVQRSTDVRTFSAIDTKNVSWKKKRMLLHQSLDEKGTSLVANAILASYQFFHEE
jgi:hypothetical protein